jgi:type III restriction enzyme
VKLELKEFQEIAVQALLGRASKASDDVSDSSDEQALILSAPTGSGKTIIATALMERIVNGDGDVPPDPDATFLWLTDQPELNEQTRRKLVTGSDVFTEADLITLEPATFDQRTFDPKTIYFLNTQKLGKNSSMVQSGDDRRYTLWETINNTVLDCKAHFWLIIDEAHRGMNRPTNGKEAATLVQKLIRGASDVGVAAVPLILGISATPERFNELLKATDRTKRPYTVSPQAVRESGLLKSTIRLFHTDEEQPSDLTLLAAAARRLKEYEVAWANYAHSEKTVEVRPALVVQVQDGTKAQTTKTPMADVLATLSKELGKLGSSEIGHCFDDSSPVKVNGITIPYVAPSDIQDKRELRVVFFKMALTTGWDCPRAEVMMSFRTAKDETLIAQLVGRMVRTPLAREVSGPELLNRVSLYLPNYDQKELAEVVTRLSKEDADNGLAGTDADIGNTLVDLRRDPARRAVFEFVDEAKLPMYKVERVSKLSAARRLLRLGRRLGWDDIDESALASFEAALVGVLETELKRLKNDAKFKRLFKEAGRIDVRSVSVGVGESEATDEQLEKLAVVPRNIEDAFEEAGRRLGGGLHGLYAAARAGTQGPSKLPEVKRELFALLQDPAVVAAVEAEAEKLCNQALSKFKGEINAQSDDKRQEYRRIRRQAAVPSAEPWEPPAEIEGPKTGTPWKRHLYIKSKGGYTCTLNDWEEEVLKEELSNSEVVGWLRNDPRKPWAFSIPYVLDGEDRPMYPDFLVFRKEGKEMVCDILEPHSLSWSDSAAKAKGLAEFANKHGASFGRIELIAKTTGKNFKRLALHTPTIAKSVRAVANNEHLKQLVDGL